MTSLKLNSPKFEPELTEQLVNDELIRLNLSKNDISSVYIQKNISIGENAFIDFNELQWVYHINSTYQIKDNAFKNCSKLFAHGYDSTRLDIRNVISIGKDAFANCINLEQIDSRSLSNIDDNAFINCNKLSVINVSNVDYIGLNAFKGTNYFNDTPNKLKLKSGVTKHILSEDPLMIKYYAGEIDPFPSNCLIFNSDNVTPNLVTSTREALGLEISDVYNVKFEAPDTVIAQNAFNDYTAISSMLGTENISKIEASAFYNCNHLTSAINAPNCIEIGTDAFNGCALLSTLNLPNCENVQTNALRGIGQLDEDGVRRYRLHSTYTPSES